MSWYNVISEGNNSNECNCNEYPGTGSSGPIPIGSHMNDAGGLWKSQQQTFTYECGWAVQNSELLAEIRVITS